MSKYKPNVKIDKNYKFFTRPFSFSAGDYPGPSAVKQVTGCAVFHSDRLVYRSIKPGPAIKFAATLRKQLIEQHKEGKAA